VERVRLHGIAKRTTGGDGPLVGSCELTVRHKKLRHAVDGNFELVEDGGQVWRIEAVGAVVLPGPERRAVYADIEKEPGVAAIGYRPGPKVDVALTAGWIVDGQPFDVVGRREGMFVRALALGPRDAVDAWEKRTPVAPARPKDTLPWNVIIPLVLLVATVCLAEGAIVVGRNQFSFIAPSIAITIAGCASALLYNQVRLPKFDEREHHLPKWLLFGIAVMMGIAVNLPPEGALGTWLEGALIGAVGVFGLVRERRMIRIVERMVKPPGAPEVGKPGVFVGTVRDQTPEQFFSQLIAIGTVQKPKPTADANTLPPDRMGFDTTFQLKLGAIDIDIDPRDATWSSEIRNKRDTSSVYLPVDAEVVVVGTPTSAAGATKLKSSGRDTLCNYGVPEGGDPQAVLRRKLRLYKVAYGCTFMVVALAAALAANGFLHNQ
jgi:hypothetical protein